MVNVPDQEASWFDLLQKFDKNSVFLLNLIVCDRTFITKGAGKQLQKNFSE